MRIDQQGCLGIPQHGMTGKMDLTDMVDRKRGEIGPRIEAVIGGGDDNVVDVEQQTAAAASCECPQEIRLRHFIPVEAEIGRRILDEDASPERRLGLVDVARHQRQCGLGVG